MSLAKSLSLKIDANYERNAHKKAHTTNPSRKLPASGETVFVVCSPTC